jgi:hypothetical protein
MWRPRDRERYVGPYDPEHEMPDPEREPGDRWQSDAYRRGARDSRFAYRWNPERIEGRFEARRDVDREHEMRWREDARERDTDREGWGRPDERDSFGARYGSGYDRDQRYRNERDFRDRSEPGRDYESRDYRSSRGYGGYEPSSMTGPHYDRGRYQSLDRGWDYGRDEMQRGEHSPYERDFGRRGRDDDRDWRRR